MKNAGAAITEHYGGLEKSPDFLIFEQVYNLTEASQGKKFPVQISGVGETLIREVLAAFPNVEQLYVTGSVENAKAWYAKKGFVPLTKESEFAGRRGDVWPQVAKFDSFSIPTGDWFKGSSYAFQYDNDEPVSWFG